MAEVVIGNQSREKIAIRPISHEYADACSALDRNWLTAEVEIVAGGFTGYVQGYLEAHDFPRFRNELAALYQRLSGNAVFSTVEGWISLTVSGNGRGHLHVAGLLLEDSNPGNKLSFHLDLDQTFIPNMLQGLDAIIREFPVRL